MEDVRNERGHDVIIMLVGNKVDLHDKRWVGEKGSLVGRLGKGGGGVKGLIGGLKKGGGVKGFVGGLRKGG